MVLPRALSIDVALKGVLTCNCTLTHFAKIIVVLRATPTMPFRSTPTLRVHALAAFYILAVLKIVVEFVPAASFGVIYICAVSVRPVLTPRLLLVVCVKTTDAHFPKSYARDLALYWKMAVYLYFVSCTPVVTA